ncbi:MAG: efflux transporter outer membrane subunit [Acidobacteriota bacterium]|nr:efflux transporter outer membrane subunit [Acidobacteriota bacterium]
MVNQKKIILIALIIAQVLLAGTVFGQKKKEKKDRYTPPAIETPTVFRGDPTASTAPNSIGDLKFFEVFKDEKLQELINAAVVRNYDLREAVARINIERANLGLTRSNQFPQVAAGANLSSSRSALNGASPVGTTGGTTQNGSGTTTGQIQRNRNIGGVFLDLLSFEIDIWGRLRQQTKAARAIVQATEEDRSAAQTTVVSDVATNYFNLLELDSELEIARRTLAGRENSLQIIKIREQGGIATLLEVRQAEELVYQASQTIPDAERQIEQTENLISLLTAANPGPIARGRSLSEQEELPSVPPGLPSELLARRPDIRAAEQRLIADNALIKAAKAAYFPTISLTGLFGFQSNQLSSLFSGGGAYYNFAPQLIQPIFTAGRLKSNVRFQQAEQELAIAQYQQTIQTAFREVSDALAERRRVKEIRAQQELLVEALRDRSRLAYLRYEGGVDTLLNALDSDRELFNAELNLTQTKRNELLALVRLYKALGGGWQQ